MRRALAPLTNVLGRVRSRSSSPSSSNSELDDDDEELQPVGDRIGHDVRIRHPSYIERNDFTYVRNMPDGTERTYEDIAVEQIRAAGLNPNELVLRRNFYNTKTRCERFKFVCADVRVCGCPYYIYVNFGRRGKGSIEECVNNRHNDHIPLARRPKIRATVRQKVVLDACVRDGVVPLGIMRRLEAEGLDQGLTLRYVQRYKANHKTAALGQAGFMGTVKEYEDLFNAFAVEDTASDDTAGVVYWEINTPQNQPAQVRVIVSSNRLLKRLSTEIVPGILGWCVDGTYKLNRERHVTVPIGVFDMHRKFYLCAFAIVPGPGENVDDFEWIATQLEKYLEPPGRETRHSRSIIQLISDSSAGLVSGLTKGFTNRQLESNRCWFHTKETGRSRPQLQAIVLARDLVPVGCKTPLQQYKLQRLEEIIRENPGCPSGFGTILPRTHARAAARKRDDKALEDNATTSRDVLGTLEDTCVPEPPSRKRRRVEKAHESSTIQKTTKETLGCGR